MIYQKQQLQKEEEEKIFHNINNKLACDKSNKIVIDKNFFIYVEFISK
jgi:hypothetical protein